MSISAATVRRTLKRDGYHGRHARKKFWVSETNRKKRLNFALLHRNQDQDFWKRVVFTDESNFNLFGCDGKQRVWRKRNEELNPRNLLPTIKHGGGSVMVWGSMSASGVGNLQIIEGVMDQFVYINILKNNLQTTVDKLGLGRNYIFQQDNDPKHTALNSRLWLLYNTPAQLHTPPQSPDVNPIEHLWSYLDKKLEKETSRV